MKERETSEDKLLSREEEVRLTKLIEAGRTARVKLARNVYRGREESEALVAKVRAGFAAREKLILNNQRLVGAISRRFLNRGMDYPDIFQNGCLGLIRAVDRFDWRRGHRLSTLAVWWITAAITEGFRKVKERDANGEFPLSLDAPAGEGDGTRAPLGEVLVDASAQGVDVQVEEEFVTKTVLAVCEEVLNPQQKEILYRRFNIGKDNAPFQRGRRFVIHNSQTSTLDSALKTIKSSARVQALQVLDELGVDK